MTVYCNRSKRRNGGKEARIVKDDDDLEEKLGLKMKLTRTSIPKVSGQSPSCHIMPLRPPCGLDVANNPTTRTKMQ